MAASTPSDRPSETAPHHGAPSPSASTTHDPVLLELVALLSQRTAALGNGGGPPTDRDLNDLQEAVDALEMHLRTLDVLERARSASHAPPTTIGPPVGDPSPAAEAAVLPAPSPAPVAPLTEPVAERRPMPGDEPPTLADYEPFRDQDTGLHSRAGFDAVAGGELKRCRRYGRVFSLILLQLEASDLDTLRRAANALRTATRESDLVGRHIDRTLAVALPETQSNEGRLVAERIIRHLEGVGAWGAEARIGLVSHPAHGETLIHLAEAARDQFRHSPAAVLAAPERRGWPD